ncbi:SDR family oxidoreductase [Euzebya tangerina]|uniref:SDR family oxidoreductase n=1 Tax=Euzebya tangerina TaxID=591198 RepID=UPI000E310BEE|nr:SDR family oxidoreductase [Euzebya tangerina]
MHIVIAGGHGQIALHLSRIMSGRGHQVSGLIRSEDQRADLSEVGAESVLLDLEAADADEYATAIAGADAVVFAAGAGPGSGAARKETVDYEAAVKLRDAALRAGVDRYVMVSAMGTDDPPEGDDVFEVYLRAKARADEAVMDSDLAWTIVRPGRLTDDPATGTVSLARHVDRGAVTREDVALVLAAMLTEPRTAGHIAELVGGPIPIEQAIADLVS